MFDLIQNHQQPVVERPQQQQNMSFTVSEKVDDRIQVSEDEEDSEQEDSDNDAFDSDDSAEVSDNEEEPLNLDVVDNTVSLNNVEQLDTITLEKSDNKNIDDVDSLDEIDDSDDEEENNKDQQENTEEVVELKQEEQKKEIDYSKLKVSELKSLAEEKNLSGYKSLKKQALIDLLKAN